MLVENIVEPKAGGIQNALEMFATAIGWIWICRNLIPVNLWQSLLFFQSFANFSLNFHGRFPQKFDEFEGNDGELFASAEYDDDDKEADAIWEAIDKRMDSRRKDRRESRLKEEIEKYCASNPKITEQFADWKRKLQTLSHQEWESVPEIGDYSLRNKKKRFESFVPILDTLLEKAKQEKEHVTALAH
ncbi:hypothetical protein M9H77_31501 [Catharanthus roseus]|uniref:Uncharacterized protein n=1 Tax=Catharanthus roseus TaxID=4058 RepID=A0ACC0A2B8_CATRO|nr:hypothetical protein M9H77_31501 [Catharanthus roseus]